MDLEEEPIELRFRKWICAFLLDRIARGEDLKRIGQRVRGGADGHAALLHRLE